MSQMNMTAHKWENFIIVISSPSGAGKSTICSMLIKDHSANLKLSISATTRPPRAGEVDGEHYFFLTKDDFRGKISQNFFIEHATVFDNLYGTPKMFVESMLSSGNDVLFDIDWQGARDIKTMFNIPQRSARSIGIFIMPPSIDELEARLRKRAKDSEATIQKRLAGAKNEMSHYSEYDYVVINNNIDECFREVSSIIIAERLKRLR